MVCALLVFWSSSVSESSHKVFRMLARLEKVRTIITMLLKCYPSTLDNLHNEPNEALRRLFLSPSTAADNTALKKSIQGNWITHNRTCMISAHRAVDKSETLTAEIKPQRTHTHTSSAHTHTHTSGLRRPRLRNAERRIPGRGRAAEHWEQGRRLTHWIARGPWAHTDPVLDSRRTWRRGNTD